MKEQILMIFVQEIGYHFDDIYISCQ